MENDSRLTDFIRNTAIHAMGLPEIRRNLDGSFELPDYSQYSVFQKGLDIILEFLKDTRKDYDSLPNEIKKIKKMQETILDKSRA